MNRTEIKPLLYIFLLHLSVLLSGCADTGKQKVHDGSDINESVVGAMTGSTGEMFIRETFPQSEVLCFDDVMDAIAALQVRKVDYVITAYTVALRVTKNNPDLEILPGRYVNEPAAIALPKQSVALLDEVNAALRELKEEGVVDDIIKRWVKEDLSPYEQLEIPEVQTGNPLRVAVAASREPMCFVSDNKTVGLDCELIERIAYKLGRPVVYSDMKFAALITALESGRADLVISNFTVTAERKKRVNFSEEYFVNPQVLVVKRGDSAEALARENKSYWLRIKDGFVNNLIKEKRYLLIVNGLKSTLIITLFAALLGTLLGGIICFLRMSKRKMFRSFAGFYIHIMRGTPVLVMLMILFYVIFASSGLSALTVAVITFALNMAAYASEMFRTSIEGIDKGQREAGIALGFTKVQAFVFIILPQAVKSVLPVYKGEIISLLKMTSVVGYIAVMDLTKASDIIRSRTFDAFFPLVLVAVIYFILAWLLGIGLDYLFRKYRTVR